ncbi:hydrolase [Vibrio maritimus]|uniref:Hydrolase n=1 Tax=Vibrio maritimus TaxID=990268 RepID=A0A090SWV7_9VIBR|nr:hydrolase [Vibrio maritimus]
MTSPSIFAIAQTNTLDLCIQNNVLNHIELIKQASEGGAELVVFPELSLTGYALPKLNSIAMKEDDDSLCQLSHAAQAHNIDVIVGCPLEVTDNKPAIGAAYFSRQGQMERYGKQYLHQGEAKWCSPGSKSFVFELNGLKLALAICADFCNPQHAIDALELGADMYLVSALISRSGYDADSEILSSIAKRHHFPVVLSNHVGQTGGWECAGKSAVWDADGKRVATAASDKQGLLIVRFDGQMVNVVDIAHENRVT